MQDSNTHKQNLEEIRLDLYEIRGQASKFQLNTRILQAIAAHCHQIHYYCDHWTCERTLVAFQGWVCFWTKSTSKTSFNLEFEMNMFQEYESPSADVTFIMI